MTALAFLAGSSLSSAAASQAVIPDVAAPRGRLSSVAVPKAYRLDFTILPEADRFSGHDEIDVTLKAPVRKLYLHGRDLAVSWAVARVDGKDVPARFTQVDTKGTARLDFATALPAGPVTLLFDYIGQIGDNASGLFHVKVDDRWYSWSQLESIDARRVFPSFDEPGFKQPFRITVTTRPGLAVITNMPEIAVVPTKDGMEKHSFAETPPLPTYLIAIDAGPFAQEAGRIPPDAQRAQPLPYRAVATQAQKGNMAYAMAETPRIVALLEDYFGQPFPFAKLDQVGAPVMPGAMENAAAVTYGDDLLYLSPAAPPAARQTFGMAVAHELAHQWFGDLVTPAWWDDVWLNESFANWMEFRIGQAWRPELNIGVNAFVAGFRAMDVDALEAGRPIHQPIVDDGQIDGAFDDVTYGKGGQVVAMMASYLGEERFRDGVRLHLKRHAYGSATSAQFFQAIADSAHEPRLIAAFRSFIDQQGVPVVNVVRRRGMLIASQARYTFLGSNPAQRRWTIPFCYRIGTTKRCRLLDQRSTMIHAPAIGVLMPNAGGTGYYRFDLSPEDWRKLISASSKLPSGEALATTDSLWAAFRAGKGRPVWLVSEARAMADNPDPAASLDPGLRLTELRQDGMIGANSLPAYRMLMASIYDARLGAIGLDPAAGTYAGEDPRRQTRRQQLVMLAAFEARDPAIRAQLRTAALKDLGGDAAALDPAFREAALAVLVEEDGLPSAKVLIEKVLASEEPAFRGDALDAVAASGRVNVAAYLLSLDDKRLRSDDRVRLVSGITRTLQTRALGTDWILAHYRELTEGLNGIVVNDLLPTLFGRYCDAGQAARIDTAIGETIRKDDVARLSYQRTMEAIRHCSLFKQARGAELEAALAAP